MAQSIEENNGVCGSINSEGKVNVSIKGKVNYCFTQSGFFTLENLEEFVVQIMWDSYIFTVTTKRIQLRVIIGESMKKVSEEKGGEVSIERKVESKEMEENVSVEREDERKEMKREEDEENEENEENEEEEKEMIVKEEMEERCESEEEEDENEEDENEEDEKEMIVKVEREDSMDSMDSEKTHESMDSMDSESTEIVKYLGFDSDIEFK